MPAPYSPKIHVEGGEYFPPPYSIDPLPNTLRYGLIPVGILALMSVGSTLTLICFILHRIITWRSHYRTFIGYNQYVVLVLMLLLADLQQGSAYLISWHWIRKDAILAPHPACFAQGWLLHSGDVTSGFFVLSIALHTFYTAVMGKRLGFKTFVASILGVWAFGYFLTALGVGMHGSKYFVLAGAWCWVSAAYETDRLALHYLWVFIVQFGTVIIYLITFYKLRKKTKQLFSGQHDRNADLPNIATVRAVNRITMLMTLYPCVYVILTLPLSAGRMWSMAHGGKSYSDQFAILAGSFLTSCGWVDSLLYTLTRKRLLQDTMAKGSSSGRQSQSARAWEANELGSKGITHTRTVTVHDGELVDTYGPSNATDIHKMQNLERPPSPAGSVDPILSGRFVGKTKTEVTVGLQEMDDEGEQSDSSGAQPNYHARNRKP